MLYSVIRYWGLRGKVFFRQGEYRKAIEDMSVSIDLGWYNSECYFIRSNSYKKLGIEDKALVDMKKYEQLKFEETDRKKNISDKSQ